MYKIIISSLCVLLGFAACRSGKGVTAEKKNDENSKVTKSNINQLDSLILQDSIKQALFDEQLKKKENKILSEIQNKGFAYDDIMKYVKIDSLPKTISINFPGTILYYSQNIMAYNSSNKQLWGIYHERKYGLPTYYKKLFFEENKNYSLEEQIKIFVSICKYPFPKFEIRNITNEIKESVYLGMNSNYKSLITIDDKDYEFYISYIDGKVIFAIGTYKDNIEITINPE